jgi:hypothetical protein
MSEYLRYCTFRRRQPYAISPIFEKLMQGFSEVKGGVITKVITVVVVVPSTSGHITENTNLVYYIF